MNNTISIGNWINHPQIAEAREIYKKVVSLRDSGNLLIKEKRRDEKDSGCKERFGNISELIAYDHEGNIRYIKYAELLTLSSIGTIEYFFNKKEKIRFVFRAYGNNNVSNRIYFNRNGKYIFSIDEIDGKFLDDRGAGKDFIPVTPSVAVDVFARKGECRYIEINRKQ